MVFSPNCSVYSSTLLHDIKFYSRLVENNEYESFFRAIYPAEEDPRLQTTTFGHQVLKIPAIVCKRVLDHPETRCQLGVYWAGADG